ncbi:hypothetical protein F4677DRAFT_374645 [Hypoxylon crocopeplum]|nr:hypothetical protein F4677DRAFT_374645 [Hypoxylon crocopeplum]
MIRHPLHSAIGRARPDLNRVADGITASLRQFCVSARRSSPDNDDSNNQSRSTSRQRAAAAAFDELLALRDTAPSPSKQTPNSNSPIRAKEPRVVSVKSLPFGKLNAFSKTGDESADGGNVEQRTWGSNVIRGGFQGRGRGGNFGFAGRDGTARRRGGGAGGMSRDDRPRRARSARGRRRGGDEDGGRRGRRREANADVEAIDAHPQVKAYLEAREMGATVPFNPTLSLQSLLGHGPAVATAGTPFGHGEIVMRQTRILGRGRDVRPTNMQRPDDIRAVLRAGVLLPPSREAKLQMRKAPNFRLVYGPAAVRTAVLEDALLGKYEGPKYADPNDTIGTLRNYVKRDATWNADAERSIEAKVGSLLGQQAGAAGGGATPKT